MAVTEQQEPFTTGSAAAKEALEPGSMTLFEHLAELRNRIIICAVAVVATTIMAWFFYAPAIQFMRHPYCQFVHLHPDKALSKDNCRLFITGPLEGFTTRLKVSLYGGLVLAAPVWILQLWRFITPGLKKSEKRYILPFAAAATCLFALGVAVAIYVFPKALRWLILVSGPGIVPIFRPSQYFTLYVLMCLVFGLIFIYPLILVALELTGVVPSARWRKWRRPAIVVLAAVAAVATPSNDPISFMALAIPMYVFYELAIVVGRVLKK
ncbi:MAG TPA: twin-arginine translocase subunit TatC [Acidimicrobiales bacterium]|nr:twin-arginine translocase subunit TatC [Acidimicrobiales bacterium]